MHPSPAHSEGIGFSAASPIHRSHLRRPLIGLTIALIAGTALGALGAPHPGLLLVISWGVALFALASLTRAGGTLGIFTLVAMLGWLHVALIVRSPSPSSLDALMRRDQEHLRVVAVVTDDPVQETARAEGATAWRFPARVEAVNRAGQWQRAGGALDVCWETTRPNEDVRYGERWLLQGPAVRRPARPAQPTVYRMDVDGGDAQRLDGGHGSFLRSVCLNGRRACARLLTRGIEDCPDAIGMLHVLMLGYRRELPSRAEDAFRSTGTLHIAAISGAHVGIVALFFLVVLKATGCPQHRWVLVLGPLLMLYALGTGLSASAVRACIMAIAFWSAHLFRRQPDAISALALAALLILTWSPGQLAQAGFLLSFVVVLGLVLLYPVLTRPLEAVAARDPWQAQSDPRWRQWLRAAAIGVASLLAVSTAAWLVSAPLTARFFNLFSPVALIANLLVVPLAFVILLAGCLSLLFGALFPIAAEIFNHAGRVFVSVLLHVVEMFNRWPAGHCYVEAPPVWAMALWLACVAAVFLGPRRVRRTAVAVVVVASLSGMLRYATDRRVRLESASMGPVNVVLANLPGGNDLLIDTGPARMNRRLLRFLRARGVDRLHALVLSRTSIEAGGGAPDLLGRMPVDEVWVPDTASRSTPFSQMLEAMAEQGTTIRRMGRGDSGYVAGVVAWEVLHPARDRSYDTAAHAGLVLRLARGPSSVLYISQADAALERELLHLPIDWGGSVLIAGSIYDDGAMARDWLDAVRPANVVLPAQVASPWATSTDALQQRLCDAGAEAHTLLEDVAITMHFTAGPGRADEPLVRVTRRESPDAWH